MLAVVESLPIPKVPPRPYDRYEVFESGRFVITSADGGKESGTLDAAALDRIREAIAQTDFAPQPTGHGITCGVEATQEILISTPEQSQGFTMPSCGATSDHPSVRTLFGVVMREIRWLTTVSTVGVTPRLRTINSASGHNLALSQRRWSVRNVLAARRLRS